VYYCTQCIGNTQYQQSLTFDALAALRFWMTSFKNWCWSATSALPWLTCTCRNLAAARDFKSRIQRAFVGIIRMRQDEEPNPIHRFIGRQVIIQTNDTRVRGRVILFHRLNGERAVRIQTADGIELNFSGSQVLEVHVLYEHIPYNHVNENPVIENTVIENQVNEDLVAG
jgi:hypothetical protein